MLEVLSACGIQVLAPHLDYSIKTQIEPVGDKNIDVNIKGTHKGVVF